MGLTGGGGDSAFTMKALLFGMVIMLLMPMMVGIFAPGHLGNVDTDEVLTGYEEMTGQTASPKTSVWVLTGIYLPYSGGDYGVTDDHWVYGSEVKSYSPTQYRSTSQDYRVDKDANGVFRYAADSQDYDADKGTGHAKGDLYTSVNFDVSQKSSIFFSESTRTEMGDGFFFSYDGYRLAFQPIASYNALTQDGEKVPVIPTTTSLSLIWYQYLSQSGVSGNLVLSGNQSGVSYLNAAQILSAYTPETFSSTFKMVFNGISMDITIRLDPAYLSNGYSAEECYNNGWWSILVSSQSADPDAYVGTDFAFNPVRLLSIMVDLFTFNYDNYNMAPWLGALCSIVFIVPMYAILLTLCLTYNELYILLGLLSAIQGISAAMSIFG